MRPRGLVEQFEKYRTKYSGDNVRLALTAVADLMGIAYQAGSSGIYDIVERVRGLLDSEGVPSPLWAKYLSFAQRLLSKSYSYGGKTLLAEAAALKQEWVTAFKADPAILDAIVNLVTGVTPPY